MDGNDVHVSFDFVVVVGIDFGADRRALDFCVARGCAADVGAILAGVVMAAKDLCRKGKTK